MHLAARIDLYLISTADLELDLHLKVRKSRFVQFVTIHVNHCAFNRRLSSPIIEKILFSSWLSKTNLVVVVVAVATRSYSTSPTPVT